MHISWIYKWAFEQNVTIWNFHIQCSTHLVPLFNFHFPHKNQYYVMLVSNFYLCTALLSFILVTLFHVSWFLFFLIILLHATSINFSPVFQYDTILFLLQFDCQFSPSLRIINILFHYVIVKRFPPFMFLFRYSSIFSLLGISPEHRIFSIFFLHLCMHEIILFIY